MPVLARLRRPAPVLAPLQEPASSLSFGGLSLRTWQDQAARACGLGVVDVDAPPADAVACCSEDVLFDAATLQALLQARATRGAPVRAALPTTTALGLASARLQDVGEGPLAVPLCAGASIDDDVPEMMIVDDADEIVVDTRPYGPPPHALRLARTARLLGWPRHWLHVLDLSLAALHTRLREKGPASARRGRRARIHPTAIVENSILGDDVRIEAHASVIDSVIGDGVVVADHSVIHTSVIGPRCRTLVDTHLRRVVAMADSTLSNLDMQDAVFGAGVFLTTGVAFFADGPGRNAVVQGKDSGRAVLGGAIGKGAILGSRALFRSGVAVPAGALIVARPEEALGRIDDRSLGRAAMILGDRGRDA